MVSCDAIPPRWGWHVINVSFPRAFPWAITFGAFGAEERPSPGLSHLSRLARRKDVSRHGLLHLAPFAEERRQSPWASTFGAFGAEERRQSPWASTFDAFGVGKTSVAMGFYIWRLWRGGKTSVAMSFYIWRLWRRKDVSRHGLLHLAPLA